MGAGDRCSRLTGGTPAPKRQLHRVLLYTSLYFQIAVFSGGVIFSAYVFNKDLQLPSAVHVFDVTKPILKIIYPAMTSWIENFSSTDPFYRNGVSLDFLIFFSLTMLFCGLASLLSHGFAVFYFRKCIKTDNMSTCVFSAIWLVYSFLFEDISKSYPWSLFLLDPDGNFMINSAFRIGGGFFCIPIVSYNIVMHVSSWMSHARSRRG